MDSNRDIGAFDWRAKRFKLVQIKSVGETIYGSISVTRIFDY